MRTRQEWARTQFFEWFDQLWRERRPDIPHDTALAGEANMSHATISSWRSGRQRPTMVKLADVATVFDIDPRHLWVHAGLMTEEQAGLEPESEPAPLVDADAATRQMIVASGMPDERKAKLLKMLDEQAREDAAQRQRLFEQLVEA